MQFQDISSAFFVQVVLLLLSWSILCVGSEFIMDFIRVMPGMPKAGVQSRIVLAPEHAKRLLRALEENVGKYERAFGPIRMPDEQPIPPLPNIKGEA